MVLNENNFKQWLKSVVNNKKYGYEWKNINQAIADTYEFDKYSFKTTYNKIKGDIFEYICKYSLEHEGYTEVYLYNKIPYTLKNKLELNKVDKGIDGIYKNKDSVYVAFQCKWRNSNNIDKNPDIDNFYTEYTKKSKINNGLYMTNRDRINDYHHHESMKWYISNNFDEIFNINNKDFINSIINSKNEIIKKEKFEMKELFDYQEKAVTKLLECKDSRMQCIMPCGTGKTYVMLEYYNRYNNTKKVVFLFPSLQLVSQTFRKFRDINPEVKTLCICSDLDINSFNEDEKKLTNKQKKKCIKIFNEFKSLNNDIKYTTNPEKIDDEIKKNDKIVIFSTYHSSNLLKNKSFDLALYDEAHKTANSSKTFGFTLDDENCKIDKRLFFTATPRIYKGKKEKVYGMNDEKIYGKEIYTYSFSSAIKAGNILDYLLGFYTGDDKSKEYKKLEEEKYIIDIKNENKKIKSNDFLSVIMIILFIKKHPNLKRFNILTYHNTIENSRIFAKLLTTFFTKYDIDGNVFTLSGNNSMSERKEIINEFKNSNISVICSARVLNEGVDIPSVNVLVFVESRKSTIDIVQCIGRGLRKHDDIDKCHILVPVMYDSKTNDYGFDQIQYILSALGDVDETLVEYFVDRKKSVKKKKVKNYGNTLKEYTENDEDIKFKTEDIEEKLRLKMLERALFSWEYNKELLFEYCNEYEKTPPVRGKLSKYKGQNIGNWLQDQKKKINSTEDELYKKLAENQYVKKSLDYYLNPDKKWNEERDLLFEYCNKNKKIPSSSGEIYKNKNIGLWLNTQKSNINSKEDELYKKLEVNPYVKKSLDYYLNPDKKWNEDRDLLFEYCNKNKKIPLSSGEIYKNKNIGVWLNTQKSNINSKEDELYKKLEVNPYVKICLDYYLKNKEKNKNKIKLTEDQYIKLLFNYCNEYEKTPPSNGKISKYKGQNIGSWLSRQKNKINSSTDELYKKLSENQYVKKSLDYYLKNKEKNKDKVKLTKKQWKDLLFQYCNEYEKTPPSHGKLSKYKGQNIGSWLQDQKKKINSTEDELYKKLAENQYVKKSLDKYLKNKEKVKLTKKQWKDLLFEYCNENKKTPTGKTKYKGRNIGNWLQDQKKKIKSTEDEVYKKLAENIYVKESLDDYLSKKKNK